MTRIVLAFLAILSLGFCSLTFDVDWKKFLGRSDLLWEWNHGGKYQPLNLYQSSFGGNGNIGRFFKTFDKYLRFYDMDRKKWKSKNGTRKNRYLR
jgi:hypothetical protein